MADIGSSYFMDPDVVVEYAKAYINKHLVPLIIASGERLEGNVFMSEPLVYNDAFANKTKNLAKVASDYMHITHAMEIGFNAGFSALLMLISNPVLRLTCVDLGNHSYTLPCYTQMKKTFGNRLTLILGDSRDMLPRVHDAYDLIHIDGGHLSDVVHNDIVQSYRLSRVGTILIMDDYDFEAIHPLWDAHIQIYGLTPVECYECPYHDIRRVPPFPYDSLR